MKSLDKTGPKYGIVCKEHAPKAGAFAKEDPASFVGKHVKLGFPVVNPVTGDPTKEHMWVRVDGVLEQQLTGILDNDPVLALEYTIGDGILFKVEEIEEVYE